LAVLQPVAANLFPECGTWPNEEVTADHARPPPPLPVNEDANQGETSPLSKPGFTTRFWASPLAAEHAARNATDKFFFIFIFIFISGPVRASLRARDNLTAGFLVVNRLLAPGSISFPIFWHPAMISGEKVRKSPYDRRPEVASSWNGYIPSNVGKAGTGF